MKFEFLSVQKCFFYPNHSGPAISLLLDQSWMESFLMILRERTRSAAGYPTEKSFTYVFLFPIFRSFCQYYDMQEHSTKIFEKIVEALGIFIQSLFTKESTHAILMSASNPNVMNSSSGASSPVEKVANQSGFLYNGAWIPVSNLIQTKSKAI